MKNKVLEARKFAIEKHADQKYGNHPYSYHLDMVYAIVCEANLGEDYEVAAYLHDSLEDTQTTKEEIKEKFGGHVAEMVCSVTGVGANRKEKKLNMIKKLEEFNPGINLKMADRLANMCQCKEDNQKKFDMYVKELNDYAELFSKGNEFLLTKLEMFLPTQKLKI